MMKFMLVEIDNNEYLVVDTIENNQKKYCLLAPIIDDIDVSNEFEIYIYSDIDNDFNAIEDEETFYIIKDAFEKKLKA